MYLYKTANGTFSCKFFDYLRDFTEIDKIGSTPIGHYWKPQERKNNTRKCISTYVYFVSNMTSYTYLDTRY